jgi:hypothetical protein
VSAATNGSPALAKRDASAADMAALEQVLVDGDLSRLSAPQRVLYYNRTCESLGLNPLTRPFAYLKLNGALQLYARKDCTDQLRKIYGISIVISAREKVGDCYVVTSRATEKTGRSDESTGAVPMPDKMGGEALANALMKAETKSKRRVTLSICGLGMLDESEIATIRDAELVSVASDGEIVQRDTKPSNVSQVRPPPVAAAVTSARAAVDAAPKAMPTQHEGTQTPAVDARIADFRAQLERCGREGTGEELNTIVEAIVKAKLARVDRDQLTAVYRECTAAIQAREKARAAAEEAFSGFEQPAREPGEEG